MDMMDMVKAVGNQPGYGTETQFIKNPLPIPKKHIKKEMDYDLDVPEYRMNYDLVVSDDDDFDLE